MNAAGMAFLTVVAAGLGGLARYGLAQRFNGDFPTGTLVANTAASGLLAFLVGWDQVSELVLGVGFAGTLSTWSTLANEVACLAYNGRVRLACIYVGVTVATGVLVAVVGLEFGALL